MEPRYSNTAAAKTLIIRDSIMAKSIKSVFPSFDNAALSIIAAQEERDAAGVLLSVVFDDIKSQYVADIEALDQKNENAVSFALDCFIDAYRVANLPRDKVTCNALGKAITQCEVVKQMGVTGAIRSGTWTEYAQGAKRAFFYGVPFSTTLKNDPEFKLPWSTQTANADATEAKKTAGKSGAVETTDRAALEATLTKAIKQAQLLNLASLHDALIELADDNGFGIATL